MGKRKPFYVQQLLIQEVKATRRIRKALFRAQRTLERARRLLRRQEERRQNLEIRQQVRTLKAAKRVPRLRLRNRDSYLPVKTAGTKTISRNWTTCAQVGEYENQGVYVYIGEVKAVEDWTGKQFPGPMPKRSPVRMYNLRAGSLKAKLSLCPTQCWTPQYIVDYSKWPALGLTAETFTFPVGFADFNWSEAARALQKAQAKAYSAEVQTNEYFVEWRQTLRLLKDPFRTIMRFHRVLERWAKRDAWIYLPQGSVDRFGRYLIVNKPPTGGILMSFRTRRTMNLEQAPEQLIQAAANRWLQYRYGIAPLVKDIEYIMSRWVDPTPATGLLAAKARSTVEDFSQEKEHTVWMYPWVLRFRCKYTRQDFYSAKQWYDADEPPISYRLGMHPTQFTQIVWNALPWSFVADWVVNIDQWLTANMDVPWIRLRGNTVTHKRSERLEVRCVRATEVNSELDATIIGSPIAVKVFEAITRQCDLPRAQEPVLSRAWYSAKNAITALALIYQPLIKRK